MNADIQILNESLNIQSCIDDVILPECGGIDVFIGTVRNATKGKTVVRLEFEAYETMALNEMKKIVDAALKNGHCIKWYCIIEQAYCK